MREGLAHGSPLVTHCVLGDVARRVSVPHLLLDYLRLAELTSLPAVWGRDSITLPSLVLVLVLARLGLLLLRPCKDDRVVLTRGYAISSILHD